MLKIRRWNIAWISRRKRSLKQRNSLHFSLNPRNSPVFSLHLHPEKSLVYRYYIYMFEAVLHLINQLNKQTNCNKACIIFASLRFSSHAVCSMESIRSANHFSRLSSGNLQRSGSCPEIPRYANICIYLYNTNKLIWTSKC